MTLSRGLALVDPTGLTPKAEFAVYVCVGGPSFRLASNGQSNNHSVMCPPGLEFPFSVLGSMPECVNFTECGSPASIPAGMSRELVGDSSNTDGPFYNDMVLK